MLRSNEQEYMRALEEAAEAQALVEQILIADTPQLELEDRVRALVRPGFYEHFKSSPEKPMFYEVFEVLCPHVNYKTVADVFQVAYASQYPPRAGRKAPRELLGENGFLTPISRTGYTGQRFRYVGETLPQKSSGI